MGFVFSPGHAAGKRMPKVYPTTGRARRGALAEAMELEADERAGVPLSSCLQRYCNLPFLVYHAEKNKRPGGRSKRQPHSKGVDAKSLA